MKIWLCTTMASFFAPMQGAARLYAYLKKQGHDVLFKDLNQDAYFTLLSRKYLRHTFERLQYFLEPATRSAFLRKDMGSILWHSSNGALGELSAKGTLRGYPMSNATRSRIGLDNLFYAVLSEKEYVISEIDRAREILDTNFFSLAQDDFLTNFGYLLCGKALIDAAYFPAQLDFGFGFHGTAYSPCVSDLLRAVKDERHNFLIPYYRDEAMPVLSREHPDVVGISITHASDFIPGLTLAYLIKSQYPDVHITLGGSTLTEVAYRICRNLPLWDFFDSLILGPGEYAFSQLLEHIEHKTDLSRVPNLVYKEKGLIKKTEKAHEFDINDACTPEYVSVRPKTALPLETASGCYWGKCIFCYYPRQGTANQSPEYRKKRVRNIDLVLDDITKLRDRYDPIYIGITDSSVHPKRLEQIAEYNLSSRERVNFTAFMRFEREFKSPAFCQKLTEGGFLGGQVGLESGSQRVNDIINKGVDLNDAKAIIKNFHEAGILIHLYTIIGIPGETREDALMTLNFIRRWHRKLVLGWQTYPLYVLERSPLAERAAEFGVTTQALPEEFLSQAMMYDVKEGLTQDECQGLSIYFYEKLRHLVQPLLRIMDIESHKILLLAQKSKDVTSRST